MKIARDCVFDGNFESDTVFLHLLSFFYLMLQHSVSGCSNNNAIKLDIDGVTRKQQHNKNPAEKLSLSLRRCTANESVSVLMCAHGLI